MKKQKITAFILALLMLTACFTACQSDTPASSSAVPQGSGSSLSEPADSGASEAPVTDAGAVNAEGYPIMNEDHTFKILHSISNGDLVGTWEGKDFETKLLEDTGLQIEWLGISQNTYNDQVGILIAANDLPDVFFGSGVPNFSQFVSSFVALDDYIDTYCPAVVDFFEEYPDIKAASIFPDGAIYGLPRVQMNNSRTNEGNYINSTWLGNLGLEAPNNTDELYEVLKAFKEQDANGDGSTEDEIPVSFFKNDSLNFFLSAFDIFGNGAPNETYPYLMVEDSSVVFYPERDNYREFLEYMHKLYGEGLIDPNSFMQEEQDLQAKGKNGQLGVVAGVSYVDIHVGDFAEEYDYVLPLEDKGGVRHYVPSRFSGDVVLNAFIITNNCEYPAAMLRLYDYLNSSYENRLYYYWGQEGTAWEEVEGGQITRLNATVPEGYSNYAEVRHTLSMGIMGPILWNDDDQATFAVTNERDIVYYSRSEPYMEYAIDEYIPLGQDTPEASQEISILLTEMRTYMDNFQAESIMKGVDDAKWEQHLNTVKTFGSDRYVELRQEYYDRVMATMQ